MEQRFYDMVEANPVIAAIKDMDGLEQCCRVPDIKVVFILYGDICNIADIVRKIKEAGKIAIVHVDLIAGLSCKEVAVDFIRQHSGADDTAGKGAGALHRYAFLCIGLPVL